MKVKIIWFLMISFILGGCIQGRLIKPSGFSYKFSGINTGLDTLININGFYESLVTYEGKNLSHKLMFFNNGLIAYTSLSNFETSYLNPIWGTYRISKDTIKTQTIADEGLMGGLKLPKVIF